MAKITKSVVKSRDGNGNFIRSGYLIFTEADGAGGNPAAEGDIIMVRDSLGRPATHVSITATSGLSVAFNVVRTIYPRRKAGEGFSDEWQGYNNLARSVEYLATGESNVYVLEAGDVLELDQDLAVTDIYLASGDSGNLTYKIFVT
jgi:hypothetical protein